MKSLSFLAAICALVFSGCATVPPQALTHVTTLKAYHKKAAQANIGAFDSSLATTKYTIEAWKQMDATHSAEYVDACKEAAQIFSANRDRLREISDLIGLLPSTEAGKQTELVAKITAKLKELNEGLAGHQDSFEKAAATVQARSTTNAAEFAAHIRELELAGGKLKGLMSASADTVTEGLTTEESLLRSYLGAQSKMKAVFGPTLAAETESVAKDASDLAGKYSATIAAIESIIKK